MEELSLKELAKKPKKLAPGHRMCAGCGEGIAVRQILAATDEHVVVCSPTGCLEVTTTIFPYSAWCIPWIHTAFENAAATICGVEVAYRSLKKKGKIKIKNDIKFIMIGGDGGTYDIGFQALSGAVERGHNVLFICLDNEAYMNTGVQRSSATPKAAHTTTSPQGKVLPGKTEFSKDLTFCMVAHRIPYVAQTTIHNWKDLIRKVKKGINIEGPAFINILVPCRLGWGFPPEDTIDMAKEATETCYWPLYEVEFGKYKINYKPLNKKPLKEWLKKQARFKHLFKPENAPLLEELQKECDSRWQQLLSFASL